jgi:hypothetical protein
MPLLDPRTTDFKAALARLFGRMPGDAQVDDDRRQRGRGLAAMTDDRELLKTAIRTVYGRTATASELSELESWLKRYAGKRREACEDLVWALLTSAEFRFSH